VVAANTAFANANLTISFDKSRLAHPKKIVLCTHQPPRSPQSRAIKPGQPTKSRANFALMALNA
jgi:hypothetical protein